MYSQMRGGLRGSVGVWYMILPREAEAMQCLPLFRIAGFMDHSKLRLNSILRVLNLQRHHRNILRLPKKLKQRLLPSNIGLILRKLRVVVCFHSRHLTICKHSSVRHISWAFRSAISVKQTMFTNHNTSAMEANNNSQHTQ